MLFNTLALFSFIWCLVPGKYIFERQELTGDAGVQIPCMYRSKMIPQNLHMAVLRGHLALPISFKIHKKQTELHPQI